MPKKLSKDEINERLEKLYQEKEKAIAYRDSLPAKTLERNKATNKISTIASQITYLAKKPLADKKYRDKINSLVSSRKPKETIEIPRRRFISNSVNKSLKKLQEKAEKLINNTKSEKGKQIIKEQLYFASLRAKYEYA